MNTWVLDIPFEWRMSMSQLGVRWDPLLKECVYVGSTLPDHLKIFKAPPLSLGWHRQYQKNQKHLEPLVQQSPPFLPRDHQWVAIKQALNAYHEGAPGFLLADEVGVGKTMSAWGFALQAPQLKTVLIVTTASAQAHWRNTVLHAGWLPGHSVLIINYDRLGKLFEEPEKGLSSARQKGKRKRLAKQGEAPAFDLVIFDESHKGKNPESARGLMMRKIEQRAKFCLFASATAGQNPIELVYLSPVLSYATSEKIASTTIKDFTVWCQHQGLAISSGAFGKVLWEPNEEDLSTIHSWLFDRTPHPLAIRRLPEQIKDWPKMQRQMYPIDLSPEKRQAYAKVWDEFVHEHMLLKKASGKDSKNQSALEEQNKLRLRQESSWLRIESTAQLALELLEQGKKVAISVGFRKVMDELIRVLEEKKVSVASIFGGQNSSEKERQRLLFQKGPAQCIVFTVEEAISLHQGEYLSKDQDPERILLVHDIRWSAIQMSQIEGRCHRDGMLAPVLWLGAMDTVDMDIIETMIGKVKRMKALHGDPLGDLMDIEKVLEAYISKSNS